MQTEGVLSSESQNYKVTEQCFPVSPVIDIGPGMTYEVD